MHQYMLAANQLESSLERSWRSMQTMRWPLDSNMSLQWRRHHGLH